MDVESLPISRCQSVAKIYQNRYFEVVILSTQILFAAAFLLRILAKLRSFQGEKVGHENRFFAVRNAEVRGSIPLCSTSTPHLQ